MEVSGRRATNSNGNRTCLFCDPCKGEGDVEHAVTYCAACNEYLCKGCRKAHTRATITKGHPLSDGDSMPNQKLMFDKDSMCPKHSDKPLDYYCKNDDRFCCSVCATTEHRQCRVKYIDDIATDFHESNEYVALKQATTDIIQILRETRVTATRNMKGIASVHANFISDLKQFRSDINNILDSLEDKAMTEAKIKRDSDETIINSIVTECDSMLFEIQMKTFELEELNKYTQNRQLMICSRRAMETINTYNERVNGMSIENRFRHYKFQPNENLSQFISALDNLGNLIAIQHDRRNQISFKTNICTDSSIFTFHDSAATHVGNIAVQHSTDQASCWITGGVIVDQTQLALIDCNNYSVKIVDLDRNIITSCIDLRKQPRNIACVNQYQIVVTCNSSKKGQLVFLKIGKTLSVVDKKVDISRNCLSIVHADDMLFVTFATPEPSVKAIDMDGNVLKTFQTHKNGYALFSRPEYICLSTDQQTVFVSDWSNDTVTSLTRDGTVHHVYSKKGLKGPRGLAVDRNDNVYIAGYNSRNIYQLSSEGNLSQIVLEKTDEVKHPCMVTYCKNRNRLYISVETRQGYDVSVYQLCTRSTSTTC